MNECMDLSLCYGPAIPRIDDISCISIKIFLYRVINMITIKRNNDENVKKQIDRNLCAFNREHCQWFNKRAKLKEDEYAKKEENFIVYDDDKLVGGAIGLLNTNGTF